MTISYRTRQLLKRLFSTVAVIVVLAIFVWLCWLLWLDRFIVYERDYGARLDFDLKPLTGDGEHLSGTVKPTVPLFIRDPENPDTPTPEQPQKPISGYHIDFAALKEDIAALQTKIDALPAGSAVLVDVKHPLGYFYYDSAYGSTYESEIDPAQFESFVAHLTSKDLHVIARLPAFRDRQFGLNHVEHGISFQGGGGALWLDSGNCFWLKPNSDVAQKNLIDITKELRELGFDEVVFTDFSLPNANNIIYNGDQVQDITNAAKTLADACATDDFWVSFTGDATFPLPAGNCRLYLENVAAADAQSVASQVATDDPGMHVLFYATGHDTRYDEYCVLRPLDFAQ